MSCQCAVSAPGGVRKVFEDPADRGCAGLVAGLEQLPWIRWSPRPWFSVARWQPGVLGGRRQARQDQPAADPDEDQVEQAKGHG
jgi:hypothetical protein